MRSALVSALAETNPAVASRIWPQHPASQLWLGLTEIGVASRERKPVTDATMAKIMDAARKAPLAAEPFLARGVQAQVAGNENLAREAFIAAKLRDGRSIPARYFLAETYFRERRPGPALTEIAFLSRSLPNGVTRLAPYVGTYAKDRRNWPQLRSLFRSDPRIADATLAALATDARNVDLVLALANPSLVNPHTDWAPRMVETLVTAGDYSRAHALWAQMSRVPAHSKELVFDSEFRDGTRPPPFNWALTSSAVGLAERRKGGGLHAIYYGQEDGMLARQLLLLQPGTYRLAMTVSGIPGGSKALAWTLKCAGSNESIARFPLDPAGAAKGWEFAVTANCPAQTLELDGAGSDLPQQVDVTITGLKLDRLNG